VALAVITTGNHYVVDVLLGAGLSLAALAIVSRRAEDRLVTAPVRPLPAMLHSAYRLRR
jgi:hypothetical protein